MFAFLPGLTILMVKSALFLFILRMQYFNEIFELDEHFYFVLSLKPFKFFQTYCLFHFIKGINSKKNAINIILIWMDLLLFSTYSPKKN